MSNQGKTALILGASGLVGKELTKILIQKNTYEKIFLLVRRPIEIIDPVCEPHLVDFNELHNHKELFHVSDVFCCLGTTIKKAKTKEAFRKVDFDYPVEAAKLAYEGGAENFLIITAMGANPKSLFFYNQVKGDVEETLKNMNLPSLHIFRPSLLLGDRGEFRLGEKIAEKASALINVVMVGPLRSYKAIKAKNVAAAMAEVALLNKKGVHIYPSHEIEQLARRKKV
ncbi:oxidoreductase [Neobacillus sp. PS2-9]|uniref:oxidoreductase n=1 Tax=Neobacillus sp. PS2-9 TaxID=3070676 RepID=UPI0027DF3B14|nr:oxidoreductase [Neobacillus sp. PS2-9]WML60516.1 oxidoreductase [Neobacillus sp. PS2-9]